MRTTQSTWVIAYSGRVTTGMQQAYRGKRLCRGSVIDRDGIADRLESYGEGSTKQTGSQQGDGYGVARFRSSCKRACLAWALRFARRSLPAVAATAITP